MTVTSKKKIVIVEDDNDLRFLYQLKLENEGFLVKLAADGIAGLEVIEDFKPDLVLVDLLMPRMGGAEMLANLRATDLGSGIRVVVLTNISRSEAPQMLRLLRVDRYAVKAHHTPTQVVDIINEVLGIKS